MKKIHFDHLNFKNQKAQFLLLIIAGILIFLNLFDAFENQNPKIEKVTSTIAYLILSIIFSKIFWFKNFVQWNKKGIVIKINDF